MISKIVIFLIFTLFISSAVATEEDYPEFQRLLFECDTSGMLLAKITHGLIFFEIAYRDDGRPLGRFNIFVKRLETIKTCEEAHRSFGELLELWRSVDVDFQRQYIEGRDGQIQLPRLAERLRSKFTAP